MPARLIPLTAGVAPTIVLQRPVLLIGRHPECDVRLNFPPISRRHCFLAMADDRLVIRDLGSHNGIHVNGRRIEEVQLSSGDEVAIAHLLYRVDYPEFPRGNRPAAATTSPVQEVPDRDPDSLGIELIPLDDD